jgi:hypothetical protein
MHDFLELIVVELWELPLLDLILYRLVLKRERIPVFTRESLKGVRRIDSVVL